MLSCCKHQMYNNKWKQGIHHISMSAKLMNHVDWWIVYMSINQYTTFTEGQGDTAQSILWA